ncbi:MAG: signal peptide peptidase SppA [Deltaproteobacteria bacterium]|nr:MAG: signal peptide peptidase SppA [Deltaproteobacteria bacterium]
MLIRFPVLLIWNILRNLLRLPFVLIRALTLLFPAKSRVVRITINKGVQRWERRSTVLDWFQDQPSDLTIEDWRALLQKLGEKKHVDGIVCEVKELDVSWPVLEELRDLFKDFRANGKTVLLYPHQLGMAQFYLGTAVDKIVLAPSAPVMVVSPAFQSFFYGKLLEELGVTMEVQRIGAHKNAPEAMTRSFPSPTHRGDLFEILHGFTSHLFAEMAEGRGDDPARIQQVLGWGVFSPEEALQLRLVDAMRFSERLGDYLLAKQPEAFVYPEHPLAPPKEEDEGDSTESSSLDNEAVDGKEPEDSSELVSSEEPKPEESTSTEEEEASKVEDASSEEEAKASKESSASVDESTGDTDSDDEDDKRNPAEYIVPLEDFDMREVQWLRWTPMRRKPIVAVIPVSGAIVDDRNPSSRGEQAAKPWVVAAIEEARQNPRIKGVVLWVNSPGGSGFASEAIWWALKQLGEEKPVVTYMENYAASGGYYVAAGTHKIISSPLCLTGSIGVFGGKANVETLMQRLKVGFNVVGDSPGIRMVSPFRSATTMDQQRWIDQLGLFYDRFLMRVAENRDMTVDEVHELAQGKVYLGHQAEKVGLVDACGSMQDAVQEVCDRAEISVPKKLYWFLPSKRLRLSELREAVRAGMVGQWWRTLPLSKSPLARSLDASGSSASNMELGEALLASVFAEKQANSLQASMTSTLLQQIAVQEYVQMMQVIAKGGVVAWSDVRWKV